MSQNILRIYRIKLHPYVADKQSGRQRRQHRLQYTSAPLRFKTLSCRR